MSELQTTENRRDGFHILHVSEHGSKMFETEIDETIIPIEYETTKAIKEYVVLLLGWVGATDRNLRKYAIEYARLGISSVRGICPTTAIFFRPEEVVEFAQDILQSLDNHFPCHKLLVHVLSNGGAFVYEQIQLLLQSRRETVNRAPQPKIAGVMFDSCPAYMYPSSGGQALGHAVTGIAGSNIFGKIAAKLTTWSAIATFTIGNAFIKRPRAYWNHWIHDDTDVPYFYVYSLNDDLTDAHKLSELIAIRTSKGYACQSVCFENSPHVSHLRSHPRVYRHILKQFVSSICWNMEIQENDINDYEIDRHDALYESIERFSSRDNNYISDNLYQEDTRLHDENNENSLSHVMVDIAQQPGILDANHQHVLVSFNPSNEQ